MPFVVQTDVLTIENTGQGTSWYFKYLALSIPLKPANFLFCKTKFQKFYVVSYKTNFDTGYKKHISIKMGGLNVALSE